MKLQEKLHKIYALRQSIKELQAEEKALVAEVKNEWSGEILPFNEEHDVRVYQKQSQKVVDVVAFYHSLANGLKKRFVEMVSVSVPKAKKILGDRFDSCQGVEDVVTDVLDFPKKK